MSEGLYDRSCAVGTLSIMCVVPVLWAILMVGAYAFDPVGVCFGGGFSGEECLKGHTRGADVYFWSEPCKSMPCFRTEAEMEAGQ